MSLRRSIAGPAVVAAVAAGAFAWARARRPSFRGRVILITGGSRGLGLVLARELAREGARVVLVARDEEELDRARCQIESLGAEALTVAGDVGLADDVERAVARAVARFGGIDVVVNDAGVMKVGPFEHMSVEDFAEALGVHLFGPIHVVRAALPHLRRARAPRIVNVASIGGKVAVPHMLPYVASKFALVGFSNGLAAELARDGIRVTTVCPGLMRTGSPPNAAFKGAHEREHAWFALSAALPGISMPAERAARKIIEACRRGEPFVAIGAPAKLAATLAAVFPSITARALALAARLLPRPVGVEGDRAKTGRESRSRWLPAALTALSDRASLRNNELPTRAAG